MIGVMRGVGGLETGVARGEVARVGVVTSDGLGSLGFRRKRWQLSRSSHWEGLSGGSGCAVGVGQSS